MTKEDLQLARDELLMMLRGEPTVPLPVSEMLLV